MATKNNTVIPETEEKAQTEQKVYSCHNVHLFRSVRVMLITLRDAWSCCYDDNHAC